MTDLLTLSNKDSVAALSDLQEGCVQLVVTSPPYDQLRSYSRELVWDFEGTAHQLYRVLCDGGVLCWNVSDQVVNGSETLTSFRQGIYFVDACGFRMHDTMIYERLNFSAPESVRYHQAFEFVFVMSKGKPKTFNPLKDRKNVWAGHTAFGQNTKREADGTMTLIDKKVYADFGMRTNVWRGKTRGQEEPCQEQDHPATMPKWLARDLILSWSNPGDLVADPFAGSGTTGQEAIAIGRRAWLNDVNDEYMTLVNGNCTTLGLSLT